MNVLIFTKKFLGDVLFETPALAALRAHDPAARLVCAVPTGCAGLLRANPHVSEVIPFDERAAHASPAARLRLVRRFRRERFDRAFLFHRSFTMALLAAWGGARERIGHVTTARRLLLTRPVPKPDGRRHDVFVALDLVAAAGLPVPSDPCVECYHTPEDARRAADLLRARRVAPDRLVALNPGATQARKRWPVLHFARLADMLAERYGCPLVITGDAHDGGAAGEIAAAARRAAPVSLCGETSLGELAALYGLCRLVISGDTGPLHVAAGMGAGVVGLFGPTDPARKGPLGRGRSLVIRAEARHDRMMASIDPEAVARAIGESGLI